ncbi:MAG TPA: adenosylcobinamide-GDP ribazoletransferase [Dehalococcoidia bacterium]|nr:adenosylcobinamide-GDP ribazoletransferase [Dehalococcoidia bacterium]
MRSLSGALDALEFLTIVRARRRMPDLDEVAAAQAWFPAIGLLLGLALLGADRAASRALPPAATDVLLVVLLAALTGALHLDGLGDAADGLLGGRDRERRLAIMRDPHAGSYAIVAIVSVLALKWAGLVALPGNVRFEALLLAPCLARLGMLAATAAFPYARAGGMGVEFKGRATARVLALGALPALVVAGALLGTGGLFAASFAVLCTLTLGAAAMRAVGGMTGDLYGASVEISEALVLLFIAAMAQRGWMHPLLFG